MYQYIINIKKKNYNRRHLEAVKNKYTHTYIYRVVYDDVFSLFRRFLIGH